MEENKDYEDDEFNLDENADVDGNEELNVYNI